MVEVNNKILKVAFITIHLGSNFGSILQAIATDWLLKKCGCESQIINYIPDRCTWRRFFKRNCKSLLGWAKILFGIPMVAYNKYVYNSFLKRYVLVSKPIYRNNNFIESCPKADVYVTGSDQVWNSIHNEGLDRRYYFDDFPEGTIKIAFSSSIGREMLDKEEYAEVKRMLRSYKAISVREASAKLLIESMGYKVIHVLDPTFMLDKKDWLQYMSKRIVKQPYILVYLPYNIHNKDLIYRSVYKIALRKGLKIVTFSWNIFPDKLADKTIYFANPGDFLSLMFYADCIVTNSFHGTAFSINLNKQFYVYLPSSFGTRILSVLELCCLKCRLLAADEVISDEKIDIEIDYIPVNSILNEERVKAYTFLEDALKN